jgi:hypothetical protein
MELYLYLTFHMEKNPRTPRVIKVPESPRTAQSLTHICVQPIKEAGSPLSSHSLLSLPALPCAIFRSHSHHQRPLCSAPGRRAREERKEIFSESRHVKEEVTRRAPPRAQAARPLEVGAMQPGSARGRVPPPPAT